MDLEIYLYILPFVLGGICGIIIGFIDFCTDKVSNITNKVVDNVTNLVMHFNKKKYNKKEEEDYE
jgi:ABC-type methionine transport system permease subunit